MSMTIMLIILQTSDKLEMEIEYIKSRVNFEDHYEIDDLKSGINSYDYYED